MLIFDTFDAYSSKLPAVLTIGNFDGVHLGHQKVLSLLKEQAHQRGEVAGLITFRNHPLEILNSAQNIKVISTPSHKLKLLEGLGIDLLFNLTFTKEFSLQDPETFLRNLKTHIPFSKIILGHDAHIGKGREGTKEKMLELSKKMNFELEHVEPFLIDGLPVSSSKIRDSICLGNFETAAKYLGRPYSIFSKVLSETPRGKIFSIPSITLDVSMLCSPPYGIYLVHVKIEHEFRWGIACLEDGSKVNETVDTILELHLFKTGIKLPGKEIDITFRKYLSTMKEARQSKRFGI